MTDPADPAARPLAGLLVVALEQAVAAPLCTARLADAGARVIKIERPGGDFARGYDHVVHGESSYFAWLNRGKESLVADLREEADRALLRRILSRADVMVQNLRPGALDRMGLGREDTAALNPRLVRCDVAGFGADTPMAARGAYDLLVQAESGLAAITGAPDAPGRVGVSISDIATGLSAHAAILEALMARERTGRGGVIEATLFDTTAELMAVPLLHHDYGGAAPRRVGVAHPSIAPYGVFAAADGAPLVIAVQNPREWRALCAVLLGDAALADDPRFATNAQRVAHRPEVDALVQGAAGRLDRAALSALLEEADVPHAPLSEVSELSAHPALRRIAYATSDGVAHVPAPGARRTDAPRAYGPTPALGAQSEAIRTEFAEG